MQYPEAAPVVLNANVASFDGETFAHIQIIAPADPEHRMKTAVICVLDISGSMDMEATQGGNTESDGFTRLDLVKHSVNTIIHSLEDGDFLGIVTFSNKGRIDLGLTEMNNEGKANALQVVKGMKTQGCTNLWDGIKKGLEVSKDKICENKNTYVVVLSDGEPNEHPEEGEYEATRKFIQSNPLTCSLSMFGYGYKLDTKLLASLTELGGGCYGYIPDCSFVGTIFVNFLSLVLSTCTPRLTFEVESENSQIIQVNGVNSSRVNLGPVQFGTTRNSIIKLNAPPGSENLCDVKVRYSPTLRKQAQIKIKNEESGDKSKVMTQILRYEHIKTLKSIVDNADQNLEETNALLGNQLQRLSNFNQENENNKLVLSLQKDLKSDNQQEGQVGIAISQKDYWKKWGIHYLPALKIAHEIQLCTNFKDPGLQNYGGTMFEKIQDQIDTIFIKLPPPEPSIKKYDSQGNLHTVGDMGHYYDQYGGCIYGQCLVKMGTGVLKPVKEIQSGDQVLTANGSISKVKCVVITPMNEQLQMVKFNSGLIITKYHPVISEGQWKFPIDLKKPQQMHIDNFYNFVLEEGHSMIINDIPCITLGHQIEEGVAKHQFLGTRRVIDDLNKLSGWRVGRIQTPRTMYKRDPISHKIIGIY